MKIGEYNSPKRAQDYNLNRFRGGLKLIHSDEMEIIKKWLRVTVSKKSPVILDLGAGTGRAISSLINVHPKTIYALDQSKAMLKLLKENYPSEVKKELVKTIVGSSRKISLPEESVDLVLSLHLFKHLRNVIPTIVQVRRVLKKSAFFVFDVLNINSIIRFNLGTCFAKDRSSIIKILKDNGFIVKEIIPLHAFGETVYNLPVSPFIKFIDKLISDKKLSVGTKFFILAQKNA